MSSDDKQPGDDGPVDDSCAICASETPHMPYRLVNCRHVFCKECLFQKRRVTGDPRCPMCRRISFIAQSVHGLGHIDLGHSPDQKKLENLRISPEEIANAMVCTTCLKRDHSELLVQCGTCRMIWHSTCTIEPLGDSRDEKGNPIEWTCAGCTSASRAQNGKSQLAEFFANKAREKRAESVREDVGFAKDRTKKRKASTAGSGGASVSFSGQHLGKGDKRSFFKAKRSSDSAAVAAAVPHSPDIDSAIDDEADEYGDGEGPDEPFDDEF